MTDKGYDSHSNRAAALVRGIIPVIPVAKLLAEGLFFPKRFYKPGARIKQTIGEVKRLRRVAMRRDNTDLSYAAIISSARGLVLIKSVHTT